MTHLSQQPGDSKVYANANPFLTTLLFPYSSEPVSMHITATLYDRPNYSGGPAVNLCRLLPALQDRGHELSCLVIYQGGDAPNGRLLEAKGVHCRYLTMEACQWFSDRIADWILNQLSDLHPDAFIANVSLPAGYVGAICRQHGIPSVSTHRSDDPLNWAIAETFGQRGSPWAASALVCVSETLRNAMEKKWDCVRTCTIPSGVPLPGRVSQHEAGTLRIIYAGRLENEQKAIGDLCTHLFPWIASHPQTELTIVGDGSRREWVEQEIHASGAQDRIHLHPPIRGEEYSQILAAQDAVVLYSHYEGTPGAILDGMAHHLVPLVRAIPGIDEVVEHGSNGFIFSEMNDDVLETLETLLRNPGLRIEHGRRAREAIEAGYSLNVAVDRWEQLLESLCQNAGPRSPLPSSLPPLPPPHPDAGIEDLRSPKAVDPTSPRFWDRIRRFRAPRTRSRT